MSQFSTSSPNRECVAISTTGDPTGSWYRYEYVMTNGKFPDYPKFGMWPNAYYMSANQFVGAAWGGQGVFAFDRAAMIAGNPTASVIYFDLFGVNPNFGGAAPADLDGPAPAVGANGIFLEWDDSAWLGDPTDTVRLWYFHPDFTTPANSTFGVSGQPNQLIPTANIDPNMCGTRACIPMPAGGESVDAISDRLMHRLQYRNFGTHQTIVTNITVDADNTDHAGVHWFELRNTGSSWAIQQEGTYAPDSNHRWMGSAAMDTSGNIAVGYSVSSSTTFPSVRYAGRLAGDPTGTLGQGEATLVAGGGVFTQGNNHRWGDYSMLAVDPTDDCTFWYTQEYAAAPGGSWAWNTRFGSFKFPSCSLAPTFTLGVTPASQAICAPADGTYTVNVGSVSGFTNPVTLSATGNPASTTVGFSVSPVTPPGSSTMTIGNTGAATAGSYTLDVQGVSSDPITVHQTAALTVFNASASTPTLLTPANGASNQPLSPTFTWSAATQAATYTLEIATDAAFTSIVHTGSGLTTTSYNGATLSLNTTYYWRVRAVNACGTGSNSTTFSFTTPDLIFKDGFQTPAVLFDSGPLITHPGGGFGGADASRLQTTLGMTVNGFGHQIVNNNSVADDFTVPAGPGWGVTRMTLFAYQTGSTTTSTINDVRVQIWNGPPNAGGTIIWGDLTTNRLASTTFSNIYRDIEGAPGGSTRPIMKVVATVSTSLAPGTYWVQWQMGGTLASGPWAPPITILGQTTTGNGLQSQAGTWVAVTDVGPQGFKFIIEGAMLP